MLERSVCGPATLGADRAYDTRDYDWAARASGRDAARYSERPRAAQRHRPPDCQT